MSNVSLIALGEADISCFDDVDDAAGVRRLAAAVVWRGSAPVTAARSSAASVASQASMPRPIGAPHAAVTEPDDGGWSGATRPGGPREVRFSAARGTVRVRDRDFPVPTDGRTLVLLVAEAADGTVAVTEHAIAVPPRPARDTSPALLSAEERRRRLADARATNAAWHEALRRDSLVQAFLSAAPPHDAV